MTNCVAALGRVDQKGDVKNSSNSRRLGDRHADVLPLTIFFLSRRNFSVRTCSNRHFPSRYNHPTFASLTISIQRIIFSPSHFCLSKPTYRFNPVVFRVTSCPCLFQEFRNLNSISFLPFPYFDDSNDFNDFNAFSFHFLSFELELFRLARNPSKFRKAWFPSRALASLNSIHEVRSVAVYMKYDRPSSLPSTRYSEHPVHEASSSPMIQYKVERAEEALGTHQRIGTRKYKMTDFVEGWILGHVLGEGAYGE